MLDAALIKACADPSLKPAIVRQFVEAVGSSDPLAITVKSGERLILVPRPHTSTEAMELILRYLGRASVRVGLTQYPAGIGIANAGDQQPGIIEPCDNLKVGTAMFAKIIRIVSRSFAGSEDANKDVHVFQAAADAWRSGVFEGVPVFSAPDPGSVEDGGSLGEHREIDPGAIDSPEASSTGMQSTRNPGNAEIRVDLSRIGGQK